MLALPGFIATDDPYAPPLMFTPVTVPSGATSVSYSDTASDVEYEKESVPWNPFSGVYTNVPSVWRVS